MYSRPTSPRSIGGFIGDVFRLLTAAGPTSLVIAVVMELLSSGYFLLLADLGDILRHPHWIFGLIFYLVQRALDLSLLTHLNRVVTAGERSPLAAIWTGLRLMPRSLLAGACYAIGAFIILVAPLLIGMDRTGWEAGIFPFGLSIPTWILAALSLGLHRVPIVISYLFLSWTIGMMDWMGWVQQGVGGILLVVLWLSWMVSFAFNQAAIVIDDAAAVQSLKTSHALTKRHWLRTAAILTVLMLMNSFAGLPEVMGGVMLAAAGIESAEVINQTLAFMARVVTRALTAVAIVSTYHDLKLRFAEDGRTRRAA